MKEKKIEGPTTEYFRLKKAGHNMFCLESVFIVDGKVTKTESTEETFLPIAFDKFRRKAGEQFFNAVEES
jgi:hypothetical protein